MGKALIIKGVDFSNVSVDRIEEYSWQSLYDYGVQMATTSDVRILTATTAVPYGSRLRVVSDHEDISVGSCNVAGPQWSDVTDWVDGYSGGELIIGDTGSGYLYPSMRMVDKSTVSNTYTEEEVAKMIFIRTP